MANGWPHFLKRIFSPNGSSQPTRDFASRLSRLEWYRDIDLSISEADAIEAQLRQLGIPVAPLWLDADEFARFAARFSHAVPWLDPETLPADIAKLQNILRTEKLIEFFISTSLAKWRPGDAIVDIGSAESQFATAIASEHGLAGHAVDPALAGLTGPERIVYHPVKISEASDKLPDAALITLHCAFEMFEPEEMRSVIDVAQRKLLPGGALVISPLYLRERRTVYVDENRFPDTSKLAFGRQPATVVGVRDYWNLAWSEWLSAEALRDRLATDLGDLEFSVLRIMNPHAILPGCFIRFTGVWRRP